MKGSALGLLTFGGLGVLLLVRLVEAPLQPLQQVVGVAIYREGPSQQFAGAVGPRRLAAGQVGLRQVD